MCKRAGTTVVILSALVLGLGATTATFSIVNAVLLSPLPFHEADRLMIIQSRSSGLSHPASYPDYLEWKNQAHSFSGMCAMRRVSVNLTGNGIPERLAAAMVSASFFSVLGVSPILGRDFRKEDDYFGAGRVAVISYSLWARRFGNDRTILGRAIALDGKLYTIIGVAPRDQLVQELDVWIPIGIFADKTLMDRNNRYSRVVARLSPGTTRESATIEMQTIAARLAADYPVTNFGFGAIVTPMIELVIGSTRKRLLLLMAASSLLLLLSCANIAAIVLSTLKGRSKEVGIRLALGASRTALLRPLLAECLLLATAGTVVGLLLAQVMVYLAINRFGDIMPRFKETSLDLRVLCFAAVIASLTCVLAFLLPALLTSRIAPNSVLRDERGWFLPPGRRAASRTAFIVLEVSVASALCMSSGLMAKSLYKMMAGGTGFNYDRVLSFQISLPREEYGTREKAWQFYRDLVTYIGKVHGVQSVSAVSNLPLSGSYHTSPVETDITVAVPQEQKPFVDMLSVFPSYFRTLDIPVLQGRDFSDVDRPEGRMVAIVDDQFASSAWPGQDPIGKRIRIADPGDTIAPWREVVGVVRQVKQYGPDVEVPRAQVYMPFSQQSSFGMSLVVRLVGEESQVRRAIMREFYQHEKDVPLYNFRTLEDLYFVVTGGRWISGVLLSAFAIIGLSLATIGIYGIVSNFVVSQRREMAIRVALGAARSGIFLSLIRSALIASAAGLSIGIALLVGVRGLLSSILLGVSVLDLKVYFAVAGGISLLVALASIVPARQVLKLNPQKLLRDL